jgi:hypothetical protein
MSFFGITDFSGRFQNALTLIWDVIFGIADFSGRFQNALTLIWDVIFGIIVFRSSCFWHRNLKFRS